MSYRDPLEAAHARIRDLEAEFEALRGAKEAQQQAEADLHRRALEAQRAQAITDQNLEATKAIHRMDLQRAEAEAKMNLEVANAMNAQERHRIELDRDHQRRLLDSTLPVYEQLVASLREEIAVLRRLSRPDAVAFYERRARQAEDEGREATIRAKEAAEEATALDQQVAAIDPTTTDETLQVARERLRIEATVARETAVVQQLRVRAAGERAQQARAVLAELGP